MVYVYDITYVLLGIQFIFFAPVLMCSHKRDTEWNYPPHIMQIREYIAIR